MKGILFLAGMFLAPFTVGVSLLIPLFIFVGEWNKKPQPRKEEALPDEEVGAAKRDLRGDEPHWNGESDRGAELYDLYQCPRWGCREIYGADDLDGRYPHKTNCPVCGCAGWLLRTVYERDVWEGNNHD